MDTARLTSFGPGTATGFDPLDAVPRSAARVEQGRIRHLDAHLDRLSAGAAATGLVASWLNTVGDDLRAWVAEAAMEPAETLRLRLHGDQLWAMLEALPETPSPYGLHLSPHPLGAPSSHPLSPHKGLTGPWGAAMLREARAVGADDALCFWPDGTLVETAIASIALEVEGELWLPPLEGRVASLAERLDLPEWAGSRTIRIQAFRAEDLHRGQLWCFNAVRGVWPGICPQLPDRGTRRPEP